MRSGAVRPSTTRWSRLTAAAPLLVLVLLLPLVLAACGSPSGDYDPGWFVRYERVWADGLTERETLWPDGRVLMRHGDYIERMTLSKDDVAAIQSALASPPDVGTSADSPQRTLTLADGSVIAYVRPDPGSASELLERLLDKHSITP